MFAIGVSCNCTLLILYITIQCPFHHQNRSFLQQGSSLYKLQTDYKRRRLLKCFEYLLHQWVLSSISGHIRRHTVHLHACERLMGAPHALRQQIWPFWPFCQPSATTVSKSLHLSMDSGKILLPGAATSRVDIVSHYKKRIYSTTVLFGIKKQQCPNSVLHKCALSDWDYMSDSSHPTGREKGVER